MKNLVVATAFLVSIAGVPAQGQTDVKKAPPCSAPEQHQFDFWIGNWNVTNPKGVQVGTNRIDVLAGGCVLHENWEGQGGVTGTSLNMYSVDDGMWHQVWMDNSGSMLDLKGSFSEGRMVLAGSTMSTANPGGMTLQRITWAPNADGTVRQHWESSEDDGKTWTTAFDGLYTKMK